MSRSDTELLRWAVKNAGCFAHDVLPRWSHVANLLGLGSTSATALCRRFSLDPDEELGTEWHCI